MGVDWWLPPLVVLPKGSFLFVSVYNHLIISFILGNYEELSIVLIFSLAETNMY